MLGSRKTRSTRRRAMPLVVAAVTPLLLVAAPAPALADVTAPVLANYVVSPSTLSYTGGVVTVSFDATDDVGVTQVYADLFGYETGSTPIPMSPSGTSRWSGTVSVPPNFSDNPTGYTVNASALDAAGNSAMEIIGDVQVDPQPQFDEKPLIFDPSVAPRDLPSSGGPVTLSVSATDLRGVMGTSASIVGPGGASFSVPLDPVTATRFEGVFNAPPNTTTTLAQYSIDMFTYDDIGQEASLNAGVVTVAPVVAAPTGQLVVSRSAAAFGRTQVGRQSQRSIVLRNTGKKPTAPVAGVVSLPAGPFVLVGAPASGTPFCLRPGESKMVAVAFRPTELGAKTATLAVKRTDGLQPGLGVALTGEGIARRGTAPRGKTGAFRQPSKRTCR